MSDNYYERDILSRMDNIRTKAQADEAAQALANAEAAALERENEREAIRAEKLGQAAAGLLLQNNIQNLPILIGDGPNGKLKEGGKGWHVVTFQEFQGTDAPTTARHIGLTANGKLLNFTRTRDPSYSRRNTEWHGIITPGVIANGKGKSRLLESDAFKNGLASLIAGHGPYNEPRPVSF